ncbi:uncharacterized protein LY89DRAFT_117044 [Mollisia scopiformis]|uniref:Stress-associated endoplasmic reticulum protein n=1 Tax=Mollisia scopiformis TaxID=149040 RepID=A0A194X5X0_MOLSC|nr:uncharacterized protein LY89DRAFT_117044 [Mollisia scopiformis]KUJ15576.1 hypothetical protein LY89DRAFT_117044 [Mollisia scopiformis]
MVILPSFPTPITRADHLPQAQTPEQRKRNAKFAKEQSLKRGKPASEIKKKQDFKSPISLGWLSTYIFRTSICRLLLTTNCSPIRLCGVWRFDLRVAESILLPVIWTTR